MVFRTESKIAWFKYNDQIFKQFKRMVNQKNSYNNYNLLFHNTGSGIVIHCYNGIYIFILAAVVCVTLLNRLIDDQIKADKLTLKSWEMRPVQLVANYVLKQLNKS